MTGDKPPGFPPFLDGRRLAAPSWVIPGTIADNCRFLAGKVHEVGLCFFEAAACLAYGPADLPADLASLPLTYHVHLPLDLDWSSGENAAFQALALMDKVTFLGARQAVLHPPLEVKGVSLLQGFLRSWTRAGRVEVDILLENVKGHSPAAFLAFLEGNSLQVCLDLGHLLESNQEQLLESHWCMDRVALFHANAPDPKGTDKHLPLTSLDRQGLELGARICSRLPNEARVMLELFSWPQVEASLPILRQWLGGKPGAPPA